MAGIILQGITAIFIGLALMLGTTAVKKKCKAITLKQNFCRIRRRGEGI